MDGYWNTSHTNVAGNQESYLMNAARFIGGVTKTIGDTVTSTIEYVYNNPLDAGYDALSTVVDFAYSPIDQFTRSVGLGSTGAMDRTVARFDSALSGLSSYADSVSYNWNVGDWGGLGSDLGMAMMTISPRSVVHRGNFSAGSPGNWSVELNNPLPNSIYNVDGGIFETDHLSRTILLDVPELSLNTSARHGHQQRNAGGNHRLSSDVGGHLWGAQFGGPGEGINLVAMDRLLNSNSRTLGQFGQLETKWASNLKAGGSVGIRIQPVYEAQSLRPVHFNITDIINGQKKNYRIYNQPGG